MRVLLVTGSYPPMRCGVGDYTSGLARAIARQGTEVGVLTSRAASDETDGIRLFPIVDRWRLSEAPRILGVLRQWRPDVVHIQYPTKGYERRLLPLLLPLLFRIVGFRVAQTWHEYRNAITLPSLVWLLSQMLVSGGVVFVRPRFEERMSPVLRASLRGKTRTTIPNAPAIPRIRLDEIERKEVSARYGRPGARLVVYFGFVHAAKGVELLFQIANPQQHHLVIVGELRGNDDYQREIQRLASTAPWRDNVTTTGFLPVTEVGRILAAADAVVLPFVNGGGEWNTSLTAAQAQGTFVVTTAEELCGYDAVRNTYFARPGDLVAMRRALAEHISRRNETESSAPPVGWETISKAHLALYEQIHGSQRSTVVAP